MSSISGKLICSCVIRPIFLLLVWMSCLGGMELKGILRTLAAFLVAGMLLVPTAGGVVYAQSTSPFGPSVGVAASGDYQTTSDHHVFVNSLAENLGLSTETFVNEVKAGQTLRDITSAQDMDDEALAEAIRDAAQDSLNAMVSRGRITSDEASTLMDALNDIGDTELVNVAEIMTGYVREHMQKYDQHGERGMGGQGT